MARQTLEEKAMYDTEVRQKSAFRKKMLVAVLIGLVILAGLTFKDDLLRLLHDLAGSLKSLAV